MAMEREENMVQICTENIGQIMESNWGWKLNANRLWWKDKSKYDIDWHWNQDTVWYWINQDSLVHIGSEAHGITEKQIMYVGNENTWNRFTLKT